MKKIGKYLETQNTYQESYTSLGRHYQMPSVQGTLPKLGPYQWKDPELRPRLSHGSLVDVSLLKSGENRVNLFSLS